MFRKFRLRFLLIGLIIFIWWWLRRQDQEQAQPHVQKAIEVEMPPKAPVELIASTPLKPGPHARRVQALRAGDIEPAVFEPEPGAGPVKGDDLKRIEGIGPKISSVLMAAGISTYAQLAEMNTAQIRALLEAGGIRIAQPDTWPEQASLAAEQDWAGLSALQAKLKGGRRIA